MIKIETSISTDRVFPRDTFEEAHRNDPNRCLAPLLSTFPNIDKMVLALHSPSKYSAGNLTMEPNVGFQKYRSLTVANTIMLSLLTIISIAHILEVPLESPTANVDVVSDQSPAFIHWDGGPEVSHWLDSIWHGNGFCDSVREAKGQDSLREVTVNMTFNCQHMFLYSGCGAGNWLLFYYMMRLSTAILEPVNIQFTCDDAAERASELILPWLTGSWMPTTGNGRAGKKTSMRKSSNKESSQKLTDTKAAEVGFGSDDIPLVEKEACNWYFDAPIGALHPTMQYDLRRMAIGLVGTIPNHPSSLFAKTYLSDTNLIKNNSGKKVEGTAAPERALENWLGRWVPQLPLPSKPLFSNVEIDDALIHFRCGDLLDTENTSYGFMTFSGYARHISSEARSIGIATQPFGKDDGDDIKGENEPQQREKDGNKEVQKRCRTLVLAFQGYLVERYPNAKVQLRNDPKETIALTYARMIMANETVGSLSSFSAFPVVASFGTGYYLRPEVRAPSAWMGWYHDNHSKRYFDSMTKKSNVVLFDEDLFLMGSKQKELWDKNGTEAVLAWFRQEQTTDVRRAEKVTGKV